MVAMALNGKEREIYMRLEETLQFPTHIVFSDPFKQNENFPCASVFCEDVIRMKKKRIGSRIKEKLSFLLGNRGDNDNDTVYISVLCVCII